MRSRIGALAVLGFCLDIGNAPCQTLPPQPTPFVIRYSLKSSGLFAVAPEDAVLFPDRGSATGLWRFRIEPSGPLGDRGSFEVAFEQRVSAFTSPATVAGSGVLPSQAPGPFRIRQLDWRLAGSEHAEWRAEIDRAAVHTQVGATNVTVGRQAVGWGRGVLFGAIDLFAPFTPLEADREWRRGVDGVRADVKLAGRTSLDAVAAFGRNLDQSAFAGRLQSYAGTVDVEIVGGRRARDLFGGTAISAAVRHAEIHGELALFRTPPVEGSLTFATERAVVKGVAGGSYRLPIGAGLLVYAEYHYSGFGATSPEEMLAQLRDPAFQLRYFRGDTQILGRHATAVLASYEVSPEVALSTQWLHSPTDASGVGVPSITLTFGDRWSLVVSGYIPYGAGPTGASLGSQFGATPMALFAQVRMYR